MELKIKCPSCEKGYRLPAAAAGKSFKCKQCGEVVKVPKAAAPAPASKAKAPSAPPPPAFEPEPMAQFPVGFQQRSKKKSGVGFKPNLPKFDPKALIGLGIAAVLLIVVVVVAAGKDKGEGGGEEAEKAGGLALGGQADQDRRTNRTPPQTKPPRINRENPGDGRDKPPVKPETIEDPKPTYKPTLDSETRNRFATGVKPFVAASQPPAHASVAPLGEWAVQPDPPKEPFTVGLSPNPGIEQYTTADMSWPDVYSPFMTVGDNKTSKSRRLVLDLRNASVLWEIKGSIEGVSDTALSPNGEFFALMVVRGGGTGLYVVSKYHMKGYPIGEPIAGVTSGRSVLFPANDRLIYADPQFNKLARLVSIHPRTRKQQWEAKIQNGPVADFISKNRVLSPGGRYLAIPVNRSSTDLAIALIDTTTGQPAGTLLTPPTKDKIVCDSLAFSPDGSRLVASFNERKTHGMWDLTTGQSVAWSTVKVAPVKKPDSKTSTRFRGRTTKQDDKPAEHLPLTVLDNDGLVMRGNKYIYDIRHGINSLQIQEPLGSGSYNDARNKITGKGLHPLHGPLFITSRRGNNSQGRLMQLLGSGSFDLDRFRVQLATRRAHGEYYENKLPVLLETFFTHGAFEGVLKPAAQIDAFPLSVTPRDVKQTPKDLFEISLPSQIVTGTTSRRSSAYSTPIQLTNPDTEGNIIARHANGRVYRVSTTRASDPEPVTLPGGTMTPLWQSEDGKQMIGRVGNFRVCHVDLENNKLLGSWRIRGVMTSTYVRTGSRLQAPTVVAAKLINGNRLWVFDLNGSMTLIDTDKNVLLASAPVAPGAIDNFTPDNKHFVALHRGQVLLVNALNGEVEGVCDLGDIGEGKPTSVWVSPSGTKAAVRVTGKYFSELVMIDVLNNRVLSRSMLPKYPPRDLHKQRHQQQNTERTTPRKKNSVAISGWCDDRYMVLGSYIVDTQTGRHLWRLVGDSNLRLSGIVDGRGIWKHTAPGENVSTVYSSGLPHQGLFIHLAANPNLNASKMKEVGPGTRVRIQLSGVQRSKEMIENLTKQLTAGGLIIDDQAKVTLRVTCHQDSKTEEYQESRFGIARGKVGSLTTYTVTTIAEWFDDHGKLIWAKQQMNATGGGGSYRLKDGESIFDAAQREINERLPEIQPTSFVVPVRLPSSLLTHLLGTSTLNEDGFTEPSGEVEYYE